MNEQDVINIDKAYSTICEILARTSCMSPSEVENVQDSGPRIARGFRQMVLTCEEILDDLKKIFATRFPSDTPEPQLIIQAGIKATSLCPHHMLPVRSTIHYGYVPDPKSTVIGLSKFVRIAQTLAKRAVIQEQLTQDLAQIMTDGTVGIYNKVPATIQDGIVIVPEKIRPYAVGKPVSRNVGVIISADHGCMSCRGVMSPSKTVTSLFTGLLRQDAWQQRFYRSIDEARAS